MADTVLIPATATITATPTTGLVYPLSLTPATATITATGQVLPLRLIPATATISAIGSSVTSNAPGVPVAPSADFLMQRRRTRR